MARTKRREALLRSAPDGSAPEGRLFQAGGYVRLSVKDGRRTGADTLEGQKELVRGFIGSQRDMKFCGLYCDNGHTGTNFARPEFERLLEDVRAGRIDCIVVKDLSRFGRSYRETGNYLERVFPLLNVRFIAVSDHFDTLAAGAADGYIVPLKNIINEAYSRDISRKTGSALRMKQKNGAFIGAFAPYGYRKSAEDPHRLEPDGETVPVVRTVFRWRLSGMSYAQITRALNQRGIPSPAKSRFLRGELRASRFADGKWNANTVKTLLANEVYLGNLVQGRTRRSLCEGKPERALPESEWIIVRDTHQAVIDADTFARVRRLTRPTGDGAADTI